MAAPTTPTNLAAVGEYQDIVLTWTASTGTVTTYNIYSSTVSGSELLTGTTATAVLTYTDSPLADGVTKYYKISASFGTEESALSAEVYATTLAQTVVFNNLIHYAQEAMKILSFSLSDSSSYDLTNYINPRYTVLDIFASFASTTNLTNAAYIIADKNNYTVKVYESGVISEKEFDLMVVVYCV
jgi:hypothetical protein